MSTCCYIIPPHILKHMASNPDAKLRAAARATILASRGFHEQRQIFGVLNIALGTGGLRRTIYDARKDSTLPGTVVRSEGNPAVSDATVNEAYDGAGDTYNFYEQIFGRKSIDGHGMRLQATVHYQEDPDEGFDNAFWNGRQMIYGDGDGTIFGSFTRSLDVIGHELTHGVTELEAGLEYHNQSGALNESFSDVFGSMVKQWKLGQTLQQADWLIGKELLLPGIGGKALRSMRDPGTAYDDPRLGKDPQPGKMSDYRQLADRRSDDWGGVHVNSGIPNRAFVLACDNLGAAHSWDKAGRIWYATLRALHKTSNFAEAASTSIMYAQQLFGPQAADAVRDAWRTVEVVPASVGQSPVAPPPP
jgi:Zn-dependent metalloprotease